MCYKELGLILIIVILLGLMFFLEGRLPIAATVPEAVKAAAVAPLKEIKAVSAAAKPAEPRPVEAIKEPSDHSYPFPRMMDGYLDDSMLQRPCSNDGDCISGNCGPYGYCAAQYKKLVPSSSFLYNDDATADIAASALSFGSWLN